MKEKLKPWLKAIQTTVMIIVASWLVGYWFAVGAGTAGGLVQITINYSE